MTTVKTLISLTVKKGWNLYYLDVNNAFLHGDLNKEVYITLPPGLTADNNNIVCRLKKSLYGLKLASRQWYDKQDNNLCSKGYTHSESDYSLSCKRNDNSLVLVVVYVDDIILIGTDMKEIGFLKAFLHEKFRIKDLGRLYYFYGLEICTNKIMYSSQEENSLLISWRNWLYAL